MNTSWILLAIGLPVAGIGIGTLLREASEPIAIACNAIIPGTGLAMLNRPFLETVTGGLITAVSLLTLSGPGNLGMYVPVMVLGAVWASLYTSLSPLKNLGQPSPAATIPRAASAVARPGGSSAAMSGRKQPSTSSAGYTVTVVCTECGAGVEVPLLHRMARCPYCGSSHLVIGQAETLYLTVPETIRKVDDLQTIVLDYYRYEYYKERYARQVAPLDRHSSVAGPNGGLVDNPEMALAAAAAEARVSRAADAYRERLREVLTVRELQKFWAPYWHGMGTLYETVFGRDPQSLQKQMVFAIRTVEASSPASSTIELPAMGHLSYLRRLAPAATLKEDDMGLPITKDASTLAAAYGDLDHKQIDRTLQRIELGTVFIQEVTGLVWRPWRIVEARGGEIADTLLIDAAAGSVAKRLDSTFEVELQPIPTQVRTSGHALGFIPMECPNCGFEFPFDVNAVVHFCTNCHRAFSIEGHTKKEISYGHAALDGSTGGELVPFWSFSLELLDSSGQIVTDLAHLTDGIDGTFDQIGDHAPTSRDTVLAPAFRLINTRLMTQAYERFSPFAAPFELPISEGRFPLDQKPRPWSVSLPEAEARRFLPLYLANIFTLRDLARANLHSVTAGLFDARQRTTGRLIYVRVPRPLTEPFRPYVGRFKTDAIEAVEGLTPNRTTTQRA